MHIRGDLVSLVLLCLCVLMCVHLTTCSWLPCKQKAKPPPLEATLNPQHIPSLNYACSFVVAENTSHSDYVKAVLAGLSKTVTLCQTERNTFLYQKNVWRKPFNAARLMCVPGVAEKSGLPDKIWGVLCWSSLEIWQESQGNIALKLITLHEMEDFMSC